MAKANQPKTGRSSKRSPKKPREMQRHPVIDNSEPLSTEEVGEILGVPPERVRELKEFAAELFGKKKDLQAR